MPCVVQPTPAHSGVAKGTSETDYVIKNKAIMQLGSFANGVGVKEGIIISLIIQDARVSFQK